MKRIIAIGDIHGELDKLKSLIDKLDLRPDDQLVFLGDYIDRGPDSKGVIDFVLELQKNHDVVALKGNHEDFAIQTMENPLGNMGGSWMMNGGMATLDSYGVGGFDALSNLANFKEVHGGFLNSLKLVHETENYIFVHGYLSANRSVEDQMQDDCLWSRFDQIQPHQSGKTVVCGHTIQYDGPVDEGFKICIDTGSFKRDGYITAMVIEDHGYKFVDSR
jgi:serine/threonine protein phosphatase 1